LVLASSAVVGQFGLTRLYGLVRHGSLLSDRAVIDDLVAEVA
jgi:hypothetical protein